MNEADPDATPPEAQAEGGPLLRLLVDMVQTRLEALVLTAQIERDALVSTVRWRIVGVGALLLAGWAFLLLLAVWLPPAARPWVLAGITLALALIWVFSVWRLKRYRAHRTPARHQLLEAVRRDLDALDDVLSRDTPRNGDAP